MKKIAAILAMLLCVLCVISPVSAATGDDAYRLYYNAMKKVALAESVEWTQVRTMQTTYTESQVKLSGRACYNADDKLEMELHTTYGNAEKLDEYYKDGYLYANDGDDKIKFKYAEDKAVGAWPVMGTFSADLFKDATITKVDEGQKIKFTISSKNFDTDAIVAEVKKMVNVKDLSVRVSNVSYGVVVDKKGDLVSFVIGYNMTLTAAGDSEKVTYYYSYKIKSCNESIKIKFPSDLSAYKTKK